MEIKFNDKPGNRNRRCNYCIVREGVAYGATKAQELRYAQFLAGDRVRQGKWSNTDWTVRLGSKSVLVVVMAPFNGWGATHDDMVSHGIASCREYTGIEVSPQDMAVALKGLYAKSWAERELLELV